MHAKFERLRPFYVINLIIPSVALSFCMVLVFLLPTESGERLGYSLTIFLSFTVVLTITSDLMPTTSKEIPIIGKRYKACADPKGNGGFRSPSNFPLEKHKTK